jgi:3-deoxy-D-manno-octulosonate 8-phosphate phosphatase (KDO 8-P phosphatase)
MTAPIIPLRSAPYQGPSDLLLLFRSIKLLVCDVDGILTDGTVSVGAEVETKRFSLRDGLGIKLLRWQGILVAWISHRTSAATKQRARELEIDFLHQGPENKVEICEQCLDEFELEWDDICYMGDDIVDLGPMRRARLAITVPDALEEVRMIAHYRTHARGGQGAVREVAEMILRAQGLWHSLIEEYSV